MDTLPPDWNEFIGLLKKHRVRYLVVGAHALAANGRPRATADLDIFVDRSRANVERLAKALSAFGFLELAREAKRFCQPHRMATLGSPPLRIDIMNHIDGVSFERAWAGRLKAAMGKHETSFLGARELRANKLAAGRPKDLADVALLDEMAASVVKTTKRRSRARR
jgi:hypothetical protein